MFPIDDASAVSALPDPESAGTPGFWTEGNPALGVPATLIRASFLNSVQQELLNVLAAAGITPSKATYNQVALALQAMYGALAGKSSITGLSTLIGGEVRDNTLTFIAPARGYVSAVATLNLASVATNSFNHILSISTDGDLLAEAADFTNLSQSFGTNLLVPRGAVVRVRQRISVPAGPPGVNATGWLTYQFSGAPS